MKISAKSTLVIGTFLLVSLLKGTALQAANGESKSFKAVAETCNDAKAMARRAARPWRTKHCKEGHTSTFQSKVGPADAPAESVDCDHEKNGKFSISRLVTCTAKDESADGDGPAKD